MAQSKATRTATARMTTETTPDDPDDPDSVGAWTFTSVPRDADVPYLVQDKIEANYLHGSARPVADALPDDGETVDYARVEFTEDAEVVEVTPVVEVED